jgi:hypothetical protein
VDYNPLKGMLILFSSLKLSIVPYAAAPESPGYSRTAWLYIDIRCQTASQVSLFVGFLISWISLPTKTTKIGTPRIKVISQYFTALSNEKIIERSYVGLGIRSHSTFNLVYAKVTYLQVCLLIRKLVIGHLLT